MKKFIITIIFYITFIYVTSSCLDNSISLSNVTNCINSICTINLAFYNKILLKNNASLCFKGKLKNSEIFSLTIDILDTHHLIDLSKDYDTGDFSLISNVLCYCNFEPSDPLCIESENTLCLYKKGATILSSDKGCGCNQGITNYKVSHSVILHPTVSVYSPVSYSKILNLRINLNIKNKTEEFYSSWDLNSKKTFTIHSLFLELYPLDYNIVIPGKIIYNSLFPQSMKFSDLFSSPGEFSPSKLGMLQKNRINLATNKQYLLDQISYSISNCNKNLMTAQYNGLRCSDALFSLKNLSSILGQYSIETQNSYLNNLLFSSFEPSYADINFDNPLILTNPVDNIILFLVDNNLFNTVSYTSSVLLYMYHEFGSGLYFENTITRELDGGFYIYIGLNHKCKLNLGNTMTCNDNGFIYTINTIGVPKAGFWYSISGVSYFTYFQLCSFDISKLCYLGDYNLDNIFMVLKDRVVFVHQFSGQFITNLVINPQSLTYNVKLDTHLSELFLDQFHNSFSNIDYTYSTNFFTISTEGFSQNMPLLSLLNCEGNTQYVFNNITYFGFINYNSPCSIKGNILSLQNCDISVIYSKKLIMKDMFKDCVDITIKDGYETLSQNLIAENIKIKSSFNGDRYIDFVLRGEIQDISIYESESCPRLLSASQVNNTLVIKVENKCLDGYFTISYNTSLISSHTEVIFKNEIKEVIEYLKELDKLETLNITVCSKAICSYLLLNVLFKKEYPKLIENLFYKFVKDTFATIRDSYFPNFTVSFFSSLSLIITIFGILIGTFFLIKLLPRKTLGSKDSSFQTCRP